MLAEEAHVERAYGHGIPQQQLPSGLDRHVKKKTRNYPGANDLGFTQDVKKNFYSSSSFSEINCHWFEQS